MKTSRGADVARMSEALFSPIPVPHAEAVGRAEGSVRTAQVLHERDNVRIAADAALYIDCQTRAMSGVHMGTARSATPRRHAPVGIAKPATCIREATSLRARRVRRDGH
jgi:hypothetical protein